MQTFISILDSIGLMVSYIFFLDLFTSIYVHRYCKSDWKIVFKQIWAALEKIFWNFRPRATNLSKFNTVLMEQNLSRQPVRFFPILMGKINGMHPSNDHILILVLVPCVQLVFIPNHLIPFLLADRRRSRPFSANKSTGEGKMIRYNKCFVWFLQILRFSKNIYPPWS